MVFGDVGGCRTALITFLESTVFFFFFFPVP
jgi:hypothetical protein